eukprot:971307-Prorocentrum_minimum.AAC.2
MEGAAEFFSGGKRSYSGLDVRLLGPYRTVARREENYPALPRGSVVSVTTMGSRGFWGTPGR